MPHSWGGEYKLIKSNKMETITENKPIVLISTFTGIVKFYNNDGSRNMEHPNGFYHARDLDFYKKNYIVKFSN